MAKKSPVYAIPLTGILSTDLTDVYQPINVDGLPEACFLLEFVSTSTTGVTISIDGVTNNFYLPAGLSKQLNAQTNAQPNNWIANFPKGLVVYVTGTAGTSGEIYLEGLYQLEL